MTHLDEMAARLEARRALPCEVCDDGEECACCQVDRQMATLVGFARHIEVLASDPTGILSTRELKMALADLEDR